MKFLLGACLLLALVNRAKAATDTLAFNDGDHISIGSRKSLARPA